MATPAGLGINFGHDYNCYNDNAECIRQLTILKDLGITKIRVNIPTYQVQNFNASFRNQLRLVCTTAKSMGFYVVWGYNAYPITNSNKAAFKQANRDGAAWAQSAGVDEWCTGNEEDLQASDTAGGTSDLNKDQIIAVIMDTNSTIRSTDGLTINLTSATTTEGYSKWAALVGTWSAYMKLDLHIYGLKTATHFFDYVTNSVAALGSNVYCGEWGCDSGRLAFLTDEDWVREMEHRLAFIEASGMSSYYYFAYAIQGDADEESRWSLYRTSTAKPTTLLRRITRKRQNMVAFG